MTIFDYLNSILYTKRKIELNCDEESQFNSFMCNRWISFYSPELCSFINETGNKHVTLFQSKQEQFDYYFNLLPTLKFKKINYIKKVKKEEEKEETLVPEFISKKEYLEYVELSKLYSK